jgi:hypothetical protein
MQPDQYADRAKFQRAARQEDMIQRGEVLSGEIHRPDDSPSGDEAPDAGFKVRRHRRGMYHRGSGRSRRKTSLERVRTRIREDQSSGVAAAFQAVAAEARRCWKHSRQNTGRPCVGLKGTVVSLPQPEHVVRVSTLL